MGTEVLREEAGGQGVYTCSLHSTVIEAVRPDPDPELDLDLDPELDIDLDLNPKLL